MGRPTVLGLSVVLACSGKFVHFLRRMLSISHWAISQILLHELLGHWPQFFFQFISWEFGRIGVECLWTVVPQCSYPTQHALQPLVGTRKYFSNRLSVEKSFNQVKSAFPRYSYQDAGHECSCSQFQGMLPGTVEWRHLDAWFKLVTNLRQFISCVSVSQWCTSDELFTFTCQSAGHLSGLQTSQSASRTGKKSLQSSLFTETCTVSLPSGTKYVKGHWHPLAAISSPQWGQFTGCWQASVALIHMSHRFPPCGGLRCTWRDVATLGQKKMRTGLCVMLKIPWGGLRLR